MVALRTHARTYCTCCVFIHVLVIYGLMTYVMLVLLPNTSFWTHDLSLCECTSRCRVGREGHQQSCWVKFFFPPKCTMYPRWVMWMKPDMQSWKPMQWFSQEFLNAEEPQVDGTCKPYARDISPLSARWEKCEWSETLSIAYFLIYVLRCFSMLHVFFHVCFRATSFLCAVVLSSYASYAFANYIWLYGYAMYVYVG